MVMRETTHRKLMHAQRIHSVLMFRRKMCETDPVFADFSNQNAFWQQKFSEDQLKSGVYQIYFDREDRKDNPDKLERLAYHAEQNLAEDFRNYVKRDVYATHHTPAPAIEADDTEIDTNDLLDFYWQWGQETAGLVELYRLESDNLICLRFDNRAGLPGYRTTVDNDAKGIIGIYDVIVQRQNQIIVAEQAMAQRPKAIIATAQAYREGLPHDYRVRFSTLVEDYTDCYVLTPDGYWREPDYFFDDNGTLLTDVTDVSGTKVWRQILHGELVIRFHMTHEKSLERGSYRNYTFETVVWPSEITEAMQDALKQRERNLYEMAKVLIIKTWKDGRPPYKWFGWNSYGGTRCFTLKDNGYFYEDTLIHYAPSYYYDKGALIALSNEEIAQSADRTGVFIYDKLKETRNPAKTGATDLVDEAVANFINSDSTVDQSDNNAENAAEQTTETSQGPASDPSVAVEHSAALEHEFQDGE